MRLQGALDNDVYLAVQRFLADGVNADVTSLYAALQRSNSSLKRQQKRTIQASIERVLDFVKAQNGDEADSEAAIDDIVPEDDPVSDLMNRSLRANLAPDLPQSQPTTGEAARKRRANGESLPKRQKRDANINTTAPENLSLRDIGGMENVITKLEELVVTPIQSPEIYVELNISPPKGVLLHGPPGCGKTMIARAFAAALGKPFVEILGPSIVSGMSGESEKGIRERFDEAKKNAPCLLFIDEIDAIAPKRDTSQSQMEKRIVAQLLVSIDDLNKDPTKPVVVIAATNRPDSIDPALRRGGRFGSEINIPVPNELVRRRILETQTRKMPISPDVDFHLLAKRTAGFVGADLHDLVGKAGFRKVLTYQNALKHEAIDLELHTADEGNVPAAVLSVERYIARTNRHDLPRPAGFETLSVGMEDFLAVLPDITPSSKREGFATVPDVSWKDVGALQAIREELQWAVVDPIQQPEKYKAFNLPASSGVLLWGPPGCGKTLLAKAVAAESRANFISVKGPELLNKFVGESEAAVRKLFSRARSSVPCVIFFDELDALTPRRDEAGSEASARVVNTLLTELDGVGDREGIHIIAATNRPDMIDEAMLRPGRLETTLFVDLPGPEERVDILKALARSRPCDFTPEVADVARLQCSDFSGADLGSLLNKATQHAMRRSSVQIELEDFNFALRHVKGSVQDATRYRRLKTKFGQV